jgi:hypothetical protein
MSSLKKNCPVKGLCGRCLTEFIEWRVFHKVYRLEIILVFSTQLCELSFYGADRDSLAWGGGEGDGRLFMFEDEAAQHWIRHTAVLEI